MAHDPGAPELPLGPGHPDHEVEKANHFARNLRVNVVVETFWGFALSLTSTYTILPVFLSKLGASQMVIALIPGVQLAGWALLQLPSAYFTTRLHRRTWPMILVHLPVVAAWCAAAFVARDVAGSRPELARSLFLACLTLSSLAMGVALPMWADYLNRQTPAHTRGRFFGWAFSAGALAALAGGVAARRILAGLSFPQSFAVCFFFAAGAMLVGLLPYMLVREAPVAPMVFPTAKAFARHVWEALAGSGRLRRLLGARCVLEAGVMASAFFAVRALAVCRLPDQAAGTLTMVLTGAQALAMVGAGYLGEVVGFRRVMLLGGVLAALATATGLLARSPGAFYLVFAFSGLALSCDFMSAMNLVLDLSPDRDKTVYQAIYNTVLVPGRIVYPLLAGVMAEHAGVPVVFRVTLALQLLGVVAVGLLLRDGKGRWCAEEEAVGRRAADGPA